MQKNNKDYRIFLNGELIHVSEEVYLAWYRPIWRTHNFARRHKQCACPNWQLCEGDCCICPYRKAGDHRSLDQWHEEYLLELNDTGADPAEIVMGAVLADELLREMDKIDAYGSRIAKLLLEHVDDRTAASMLGLARSTYSDKKIKIRKALKNQLKD